MKKYPFLPLSNEEAARISAFNDAVAANAEAEFEEFKYFLKQNICPMCRAAIDYFDETAPCMHWLLNPPGFRKKYFSKITDNFDYHRIESFLRWYVNILEPFKNINDLRDENDESKVISLTINYKNLEWSFSCSKGCYEAKQSKHPPHYHFQMRVSKKPFINYSDFHIPLTSDDIELIEIKLGNDGRYIYHDGYGAGIGAAIESLDPEILLKNIRKSKGENDEVFRLTSLVAAKDGEMIDGEKMVALIERHLQTGEPLAELLKELEDIELTTYISPGNSIPSAAPRTKNERNRKKKR